MRDSGRSCSDRVPGPGPGHGLPPAGRGPAPPRVPVGRAGGMREAARRCGRSPRPCCASAAGAASAATAGWRWTTATRTSSWSSRRGATSTWTPSATEVWHPAYRTAPEPGRKVFLIREADRLNPAAADTLLKVWRSRPADAVIVLLSARPRRAPRDGAVAVPRRDVPARSPRRSSPTTLSARAPIARSRAARRPPGRREPGTSPAPGHRPRRALRFRDVGAEALRLSATGPRGALDAADVVLEAAERYRKGLKDQLEVDLAPFLDERGQARGGVPGRDPPAGGAAQAAGEAGGARLRRLGAAGGLRRCSVTASWPPSAAGASSRSTWTSRPERGPRSGRREDLAASAWRRVEEARAALAEELNLNPRLVLERAFLQLAEAGA